jgi:hypothetical protein
MQIKIFQFGSMLLFQFIFITFKALEGIYISGFCNTGNKVFNSSSLVQDKQGIFVCFFSESLKCELASGKIY